MKLDKCSRCQGVWLDLGELDRVVAEEKGVLSGRLQAIARLCVARGV